MTGNSAAKAALGALGVLLILGGSCAGLLGTSDLGGPAPNVVLIVMAVAAIAGGIVAIVWSRR